MGPYFAVDWHAADASPAPPWRPLATLADDCAVLAARIDLVRAALAAMGGLEPEVVERRVAASTAHLGIVARVIAPAVGLAVLGSPAGNWRLAEVWWQDCLGGPLPLSIPGVAADDLTFPRSGQGDASTTGWLLDQLVAPLTDAVATAAVVSPRVLWGNAASAANTAAGLIASQHPELAAGAWAWATAFFDDDRLASETQRPGPGFRRSSCCLLYRLGPGASSICGDCVLGSD
jgi:hypothetical protein